MVLAGIYYLEGWRGYVPPLQWNTYLRSEKQQAIAAQMQRLSQALFSPAWTDIRRVTYH